jgi:hypothetical protein
LQSAAILWSCDKEDIDDSLLDKEDPKSTIDTLITNEGVQFVRTPDAMFQALPD